MSFLVVFLELRPMGIVEFGPSRILRSGKSSKPSMDRSVTSMVAVQAVSGGGQGEDVAWLEGSRSEGGILPERRGCGRVVEVECARPSWSDCEVSDEVKRSGLCCCGGPELAAGAAVVPWERRCRFQKSAQQEEERASEGGRLYK